MAFYRGLSTLVVVFGVILSFVEFGSALKCWRCTSQTDATCRDYFNTTRILLNQKYMEPYSFGNNQPVRSDPHMVECDEMHTSTYGHFKNVCLKRVYTVQYGPNQVHRECRLVPKDMRVGTCPDDILNNRPQNLEYCGTCELDGCNSASTNGAILLGLVVPAVLLILGK